MAISDVADSHGRPSMRMQPGTAQPIEGASTKPKTLEQIAAERRQSRRETLVTAAATRRADTQAGAEETKIYVANISLHGIAFRCRERFEKGSLHYLKLSAGPLKLESLVRIQWCRQRTDGTFDVGSQFMEVPGEPVDPPKLSA